METVKRDVKEVKNALTKESFKVAIFGSAKIRPGNKTYTEVKELAKMIGSSDMDLVTGGGPGLMQAANQGHKEGKSSARIKSIGLLIHIPHEHRLSQVDIERKFTKFSERLDNFMLLSNAVVVTPGGVGTMLELFYTWQLLQTRKIRHIPVILMGEMWHEFIRWIKSHPVKNGFISPADMKLLHVAHNAKETMQLLQIEYRKYKKKR
jgi:uncharacterized protein (TIGR00730 family)